MPMCMDGTSLFSAIDAQKRSVFGEKNPADYRRTQRSLRITHFSPRVTSRPSWSMQSAPCLCSSAIPTSRSTTKGGGAGALPFFLPGAP